MMTLKWVAVVVAAVAATLCVTVNVLVDLLNTGSVPVLVNMIAITTTAVALTLAVLGALHERIDARINALTEFLVVRLNELDTHTGDRNAGFVEGYLLSHGQEAEVIPIGPRVRGRAERAGTRSMGAAEDCAAPVPRPAAP